MSKRLGKISTKIVIGKITDAMIPATAGEVNWLYDVAGIARAIRQGESNFGAWTSFIGFGRAIRHSDKVVFNGDEVFLPGIATGRIEAFLRANPGTEVQFVYRVGVRAGEGQQRYEYVVESLTDESEADPLAGMLEKAPPLAALPAPGEAPAPAAKGKRVAA